MKKLLFVLITVCVWSFSFAQVRSAVKDLSKQKAITLPSMNDAFGTETQVSIPFTSHRVSLQNKKSKSVSAVTSVAIGTSANIYTVLHDGGRWLSYNNEVNALSFIHRQGGPWGGTSGNLLAKYSTNLFATKDSVSMNATTPNLFRYPNGVIYNPIAGNTNVKQAYVLFGGPATPGSGWVNNYFGCKKMDGTGGNTIYDPLPADTNLLCQYGFTGGNGLFHIMSPVYISGGSGYLYHKVNNVKFNSSTNLVEHTACYIHPLMKMRTFSDGVNTWDGSPNIVFAENGLYGYFYHFGADSIDDPYNTSIPNLWKTTDGGVTFTKEPVYYHFDKILAIRNNIFPTYASWSNPDTTKWIFRPDFPAGAAGNEGHFPGAIDKNNHLHIATVVEGRYSSVLPDSSGYGYANHPIMLFDVFQTDTGWDAVFIDTIRTFPVDAATSGFGTGTAAQGWEHYIKMSKDASGSKIFVTWTDTDPTIDTTNIMPEVRSWAWDVNTNMMTAPTTFESGSGNIFYMATAEKVIQNASTYKIPVTYVDIYESGNDPASPQKHYYMDGVQFNDTDFNIQVPYVATPVLGYNISGVFNYKNTGNTALTGINLKLMNGLVQVATTTTNSTGNYSFSTLPNGSYTIDATTTKPWGGVTATDALKIKRHVVGVELLTEPIKLSAADANLSYTINSTDALKVQRRIAGLDASFARADWNFWPTSGNDTIIVNGANVTQNFYGLCTGDVNGSYNPPAVARQSLMSIDYTSTLFANLNETFELPVRITKPVEIGAMQLFINYPSDLIKVEGMSMSTQDGDLVYNAENGQLRIVWTSLSPLSLNENDALVTLKLKAVNNFTNNVSIGLTNESELADAIGNEIGAGIHTSTIELSNLSDINSKYNIHTERSRSATFLIYPNPAKNNIFIDLGKYSSKDVTVSICNSLGKQVATINKPEMNNIFKFNFAGFANGLYIIQINTQEGKIVKSVSINK